MLLTTLDQRGDLLQQAIQLVIHPLLQLQHHHFPLFLVGNRTRQLAQLAGVRRCGRGVFTALFLTQLLHLSLQILDRIHSVLGKIQQRRFDLLELLGRALGSSPQAAASSRLVCPHAQLHELFAQNCLVVLGLENLDAPLCEVVRVLRCVLRSPLHRELCTSVCVCVSVGMSTEICMPASAAHCMGAVHVCVCVCVCVGFNRVMWVHIMCI